MHRSSFCARAVMSAAVLLVIVTSAPAFGHAALTRANPENGAELDAVPGSVEINYSEPPTTDAKFEVMDGCGRNVARNVDVLNQVITADVESGQPGDWSVEWAVVSAVDGHLTRDGISFTVAGEPDCNATQDDSDEEEAAEAADLSVLVPVVVATVVILGVGAFFRFRSRSNP